MGDFLGNRGLRHEGISWGTMTIQCTPKRSATMPKQGEKKVLVSGITTFPPSARALNHLSASASSLAGRDSPKPSNLGFPEAMPSDASTVPPLILKAACSTLSSLPGVHMVGSGLSLL